MTLLEKRIEDKYEISGEFFDIGVREATLVTKDGEEISRSNHRKVFTIGHDVSNESENVKSLAALFWTDELKTKYAEMVALQELAGPDQGVTAETKPTDIPLNPVQFFTLLETAFNKTEQDVIDQINASAMPDAEKVAARNRLSRSTLYYRDNPLFDMLAGPLNISSEQIDTAWEQALQI